MGIKTRDITIDDLRRFAAENDITRADGVIEEARQALAQWDTFANEAQVPKHWVLKIGETLNALGKQRMAK
jgi:hypothetical protein